MPFSRSKPSNCPWATCAVSFAIGTLSGREAQAFEEHLVQCDDCRSRLAQVDDILQDVIPASSPEGGSADEDWSDERSARIQRKIFERIRTALGEIDE